MNFQTIKMETLFINSICCVFVAMLIFVQFFSTVNVSFCSEATTPDETSVRSTNNPQCADEDRVNKYANELLQAFKEYSEDINLQKRNLALPLKKVEIDWDAKPYPKKFTQMLSIDQLSFPLVPNKEERKARNINYDLRFFPICLPSSYQPNFRFLIILSHQDEIYSYEFEKRDDWELISIENRDGPGSSTTNYQF